MPWMALRRSRVRSWPRPVRWRQMSAIPAAPAMIGMAMHAPSRCLVGKIGSSPTKVMLPPVSSGDSPRSCITERNSALMSKLPEPLDVLLVMMIPFKVVDYSVVVFVPRFRNSLAGSAFSGVAIAGGSDVGCCVLLQLCFEGLRFGKEADDAAAISAILDAEVRHEIANATLPHQLRRIVRHLRWPVAGRVRRPPDGVGIGARPRRRAQRHRRGMAERHRWSEPREGAPRAELVHAMLDEAPHADRRVGLIIDRLDQRLTESGSTTERGVDAPEPALLFPLGQRRHHRNGQQIAGEMIIHQSRGHGRSLQ